MSCASQGWASGGSSGWCCWLGRGWFELGRGASRLEVEVEEEVGVLANRQEYSLPAPPTPPPVCCRNRDGCDWLMAIGLVLRGLHSDSPCPGWDARAGVSHCKTGLMPKRDGVPWIHGARGPAATGCRWPGLASTGSMGWAWTMGDWDWQSPSERVLGTRCGNGWTRWLMFSMLPASHLRCILGKEPEEGPLVGPEAVLGCVWMVWVWEKRPGLWW